MRLITALLKTVVVAGIMFLAGILAFKSGDFLTFPRTAQSLIVAIPAISFFYFIEKKHDKTS